MEREEQGDTSGVDKETEEELDYEEEDGKIAKKLLLGWEGLEESWKIAIGRRAKDVRNCHINYRKDCGQCKWSRKRAQRDWEIAYKEKVSKKLDSKRYRQTDLRG